MSARIITSAAFITSVGMLLVGIYVASEVAHFRQMSALLVANSLAAESDQQDSQSTDQESERARQDAEAETLRRQWSSIIDATPDRVDDWLQVRIQSAKNNTRVTAAAHSSKPSLTYWTYRPIQSVSPQEVVNDDWCLNPIDRFILAKLEVQGVGPNSEASPEMLVRRLHFDMLGLPPQWDQMSAELTSGSSVADYASLVDHLLNNPAFGERWASVWLDLARYADTNNLGRVVQDVIA